MIDDVTRLCAQLVQRLLSGTQRSEISTRELFKAVIQSHPTLKRHLEVNQSVLIERFVMALKILDKMQIIAYRETHVINLKAQDIL